MPEVSKEELTTAIKRCSEGLLSPQHLVHLILNFTSPEASDQFDNKIAVVELIKSVNKNKWIEIATALLQKELGYPRRYNFKNALFQNPAYPQICIDSRSNSASTGKQFWFGTPETPALQSFAYLQARNALQKIALASCGNSSAVCITLSQQEKPGIKLSRNVAKWLVRLFNHAKSAESLKSSMPNILNAIAKYINQFQMSDRKNVYGVAMRVFSNPENVGQNKIVYCGVGNCDLFLLSTSNEGSLEALITAQEEFSLLSGFSSKGFRDTNQISFDMLTLPPHSQIIFTTPPALSKYTIITPLRNSSHAAIPTVAEREMRRSREDLRLLEQEGVIGFSYPCDNLKLKLALTQPNKTIHEVILQTTENSFSSRHSALQFIAQELQVRLAEYRVYLQNNETKARQENANNLIGFFNWLDTLPRDKVERSQFSRLDKAQINMLLYYVDHENTAGKEISIEQLAEIAANPTKLPKLPPNCFLIRFSEIVQFDSIAQLEIAYNKIEALQEKQRYDAQRLRLEQSQISSSIQQFLLKIKNPGLIGQWMLQKDILEFYQRSYEHFEKIKKIEYITPADQLNHYLLFILDLNRSEPEKIKYIKQDLQNLLNHSIKQFFQLYIDIPFGLDEAFASNLHLHALQHPILPSTPWKMLFLQVAQLVPSSSASSPPSCINWPEDESAQSPLEEILIAWLRAQENRFTDCAELQKKLDLHKATNPFIQFLQAMLLLNINASNHCSIDLFKSILVDLKNACQKNVVHAVNALTVLLRNEYYEKMFQKIPCYTDCSQAQNGSYYLDWAKFLMDETQRLLLPEPMQIQAKLIMNSGVELLRNQLSQSDLQSVLLEQSISIEGYYAFYWMLRNQPLFSMNYAIIAISKQDALGLYTAIRVCNSLKQHLNSQIKHNLIAHSPFVTLLFKGLHSKPDTLHESIKEFARIHDHPVAAYLGAHPRAFFSKDEIDYNTYPDITLLTKARNAGLLDWAGIYDLIPPDLSRAVMAINDGF